MMRVMAYTVDLLCESRTQVISPLDERHMGMVREVTSHSSLKTDTQR
jgi:hypothetical protein